MKDTPQKPLYCFDSSVFIDGWRRYYKHKQFKGLWDNVGRMIDGGIILVPEEVKKEIGTGKDELSLWFKQFNPYIIPIDVEQMQLVADIVNQYPAVSHYKKVKPVHADPFIISVAKQHNCKVVSWEGRNKSPVHPRIPDLCDTYKIEHITPSEFFEEQSWMFSITQ